jgi:tRNA(adenine34) deaminase
MCAQIVTASMGSGGQKLALFGASGPTVVRFWVRGAGRDGAASPYFGGAAGVSDEQLMRFALNRAREAWQRGEVPVGAIVVVAGEIAGEGYNQPIGTNDPTAHAEIVAMRQASAGAGNYRLTGATVYVTIEPCQMCVGAMVHARIGRLVYGAPEPKAGAIESAMRAHEHPALNHRIEVTGRVLEAECRELMQGFFERRRASSEGRIR